MVSLWSALIFIWFLGKAETSQNTTQHYSAVQLVNQTSPGQQNTANVTAKPSFIERDLITFLLFNYSVYARPTTSSNQAVMIDFEMKLGKLVKLDIKEQVLVAKTRITMAWEDPSLVWSKSNHNGTDIFIIPSSKIWTPDIVMYNTAEADSKSAADIYKGRIRVSDTGKVTWISAVPIVASCSVNIKYFPFDEQSCTLIFGSISYTKHNLQLRFRKQPASSSDFKGSSYITNGQWQLKSLTAVVKDKYYDCCDVPFSTIEYTLTWQRLPGYWLLYLVFPCVCLSLIAICTFFIPADSGERSGFCITTVLAMSVYLLVISDKLPEKSDQIPLIGMLYTFLFALMVGILLSTILMVNLVAKKTKPSAFLKRLIEPKGNSKISPSGIRIATIKTQKGAELDDFEGKSVLDGSTEMACVKRCSCSNQNGGEEPKYPEEWQEITRTIDKKLFWFFSFLGVILQLVVLLIYYT